MTRTVLGRRRARLAVTAMLAVAATAATVLIAAPAQAAELTETLNPANRLGTLTVTEPATRTLRNAGDPAALTATLSCPENFRGMSRTFLIWSDGTRDPYFAADPRLSPGVAGDGFDGQPLNLTGSRAATWSGLSTVGVFHDDPNATYVVTCDPGTTWDGAAPDARKPIGDAKYFTVGLKIDATNQTWTVVTSTEPSKTATTTTVVASGITETSATLTATVAPTAATGTVQFTKDGTNVGAPAAVTNGQASVSVSDLTAGTAYTFGAAYSGDTTHDASTGSVQATTVAGPPPADSSETDVTVTVPQADAGAPTGLKISTAPAPTIALTGPATRAAQQEWVATGQLGAVTVTDDRRDGSKSPWTLTGAATAFTAGTNQIPAAQLTWTPSKTAGAGTAGTAGPITTAKQLATGTASATANVTTTVAAGLSLAVPASAAAGDYKAKLTLTLI